MENKMGRFIHGALILTLAGLFSKVLSALYRIPIQNLTGDIGFYIYQQIYPMIATIVILSLYSFPAAISKIGAERGVERQSMTSFIIPNLLILICLNGGIFLIIYITAPTLALQVGDSHLAQSYRYASLAFLVVPFLSLLRGYFQATERMEPTAYSQVVEQIVRVSLIIITAYFIFKRQADLYQIGEMGALATVIGLSCATFYLLYIFMKERWKNGKYVVKDGRVPYRYYIKTIVFFGFAVALNHMIFIMMQFGDMFTLIPNLMKHGLSLNEAMATKGVFDRGVPLIQLGIVVGSSFALALIPTVTAQRVDEEGLARSAQNALAISCYLATGATVGLIILFPETNMLLFQSHDGLQSIRLFVGAIVILSMTMTANAILQSMGHLVKTSFVIIGALLLKVVLNYCFVPVYGLLGAAIATISSLAMLCVTALYMLSKTIANRNLFKKLNFLALIIASSGMVVYLLIVKWAVPFYVLSRSMLLIYVVFLVGTGAIVYLLLLLRFQAFTEAQIKVLPFSNLLRKQFERLSKRK